MTNVPVLCMTQMICYTHEKLNHINLFMNASSSLLKNSDLCCEKKKKLIWFRKIRYVFVHVKKIVFGMEKSDLCLLNKTKSFGF